MKKYFAILLLILIGFSCYSQKLTSKQIKEVISKYFDVEYSISKYFDTVTNFKNNYFKEKDVFFEENEYMNKRYSKIINGKNVVVLTKKEIDSKTKQSKNLTLRRFFISNSSEHGFTIQISSFELNYSDGVIYSGFADAVQFKLEYNVNDRKSYTIEEIPHIKYIDE